MDGMAGSIDFGSIGLAASFPDFIPQVVDGYKFPCKPLTWSYMPAAPIWSFCQRLRLGRAAIAGGVHDALCCGVFWDESWR